MATFIRSIGSDAGWPHDPWQILDRHERPWSESRWSGADADALVESMAVERAGGSAPVDGPGRGEFMLSSVTRREHLVGMFGGVEGFGPVVDRVHEFLRRRIRGPERVLSPAEALELAKRHQEAFRAAHVAYREAYDKLPDLKRLVATDPSFFEPTLVLADLDVVWVDAESGGRPVLEWAGDNLRVPWYPERPSAAEIAEWSLAGSSEEDLMSNGFQDLNTSLFRDGGDGRSESLRRTLDFRLVDDLREALFTINQNYIEWPGGWCLAPLHKASFDLDPYFELWSGGASLWVGRDAIEVRTDYAVRFSHQTCPYQD